MIRKAVVQIKEVDPYQAGEEGTLFPRGLFCGQKA
jgi:hypothetical protein